ncbi:MAG: class I SAM-dependent methyltransferase [Bryobacterales bacterium]|nr:class I SAM-dependent methyltransferase [Bryobacterales bacterium]
MSKWNPGLYEGSHSFVWEYGRGTLDWLAVRPGERILDIGCGTGQLTAEIAAAGAKVIGVDLSSQMIDQARWNYPGLEFEVADVRHLPFNGEFDAVFSNAALHWVCEAERAAASIARALRRGGRFVAEFGGHGNIGALMTVVYEALNELGVDDPASRNPWYFPRLGEYCALLEQNGLEVRQAVLFPRPTALEGGRTALDRWFAMFGQSFTADMTEETRTEFLRKVEARAANILLQDDTWTVDYRRLRVLAIKQ